MSENLEALERRTHSVRGIRSVVHTMKTLSAINASPCEQASRAIIAYLDVVLIGLQGLLHGSSKRQILSGPEIKHRIILALGTDHGMCGNYNERVAEHVMLEKTKPGGHQSSPSCIIVCVGARLDDALLTVGITSEHVLFTTSTIDGLTRLAGELVAITDNLTHDLPIDSVQVQMVYTALAEHGQLKTVVRELLPIPKDELAELRERNWQSRSRPWFRQPESSLLAELLRNYLFASICRAATEALLSENRARLTRMRQAEEAVDEQLVSLTTRSRSARQNRITEELQDVNAGFEAVKHE